MRSNPEQARPVLTAPSPLAGGRRGRVSPVHLLWSFGLAGVVVGFYFLGRRDYLLFHSIIEIVSVAAAFTIFAIGWHSRMVARNNLLLVVGVGYLLVAGLDTLHALAYKGLNVFPDHGADLPTQLWLAGRYVQAAAFLAGVLALGSKTRVRGAWLVAAYSAAALVLVLSIFVVHIFPTAYIEGAGLTPFKVGSEYAIVGVFALAGLLLWRKRALLGARTTTLWLLAIGLLMGAELAFTLYVDVYGFFNYLGHVIRLCGYVVSYLAIVQGSLEKPYEVLFHDLTRSEEALRHELAERERYEAMLLQHEQDHMFLSASAGRLIASRDSATAYRHLASDAMALTGSKAGFVATIEPDGRLTVKASAAGPLQAGYTADRAGARAGSIDALMWEVVATQAPVLVTAPVECGDGSLQGFLGVPLWGESGLCSGLIGVAGNRDGYQDWTRDLLRLLAASGSETLIAISNAELIAARTEELERMVQQLSLVSLEARQASQAKSQFLANMSHELRTPLNAVLGFAQVLQEKYYGDLTPKQEEYLNDILESGEHLLSLINDVLDLSRVEAGRLEYQPTALDLDKLVDSSLNIIKEKARAHSITLSRDPASGLGTIAGDERALKQVLFNLLANAIKFTPDGGRIGVIVQKGAGEVVIAVTDTGIGIAEQDLPRIFQPFEQVGDPTRWSEGTGLGLSLVKRLVEAHGGAVWAESKPGQGSRFTFRIPQPPRKPGATEVLVKRAA